MFLEIRIQRPSTFEETSFERKKRGLSRPAGDEQITANDRFI